ncbi:hypothetical protein BST61_g7061 [Cercospora zeina]
MPPYLTSITLTSATGDVHRSIDLIPGEACLVGRTSKSKREMLASPNNARFDCAVVSRQHAEIRSVPWAASGAKITVTDLKSLHGTAVNGRRLLPHADFTLKDGDVIRFGERVDRGEEAHDGVSVIFRHIQQHDSLPDGNQNPAPPRTIRGYQVPDESESDFDSDIESAGSGVKHITSAETTPEQHKMGSQSKPIDLDEVTAAHKKVISLLDEDGIDHEENEASLFTTAVPETINLLDHEPMTPAESAPGAVAVAPTFYNLQESDFDDALEGVATHNTGLSNILNERADEQSVPDEDQVEDHEHLDPELSEDEMDDYEPEYISQRQPSEELGRPIALNSTSFWGEMQEEDAIAAPKPHYDPVRSLQPAADETTAATVVPEPSRYTRRWDVPPPVPMGILRGPMLPSYDPLQQTTTMMHTEKNGRGEHSEFHGRPTAGFAASESSRGKLAIGNLLQSPGSHISNQTPRPALEASWARPQVSTPAVSADAAQTAKPMQTNKRKASEVSDIDIEQAEEPAAKKVVTVDASTGTQRAIATQPGSKSNAAQRIVSTAFKHAISAGAGVAATIAFLNSTYAERVIEYLS